jgi:hypothetical protein
MKHLKKKAKIRKNKMKEHKKRDKKRNQERKTNEGTRPRCVGTGTKGSKL